MPSKEEKRVELPFKKRIYITVILLLAFLIVLVSFIQLPVTSFQILPFVSIDNPFFTWSLFLGLLILLSLWAMAEKPFVSVDKEGIITNSQGTRRFIAWKDIESVKVMHFLAGKSDIELCFIKPTSKSIISEPPVIVKVLIFITNTIYCMVFFVRKSKVNEWMKLQNEHVVLDASLFQLGCEDFVKMLVKEYGVKRAPDSYFEMPVFGMKPQVERKRKA